MAKKEAKTDLWVASQLIECGIRFDAQGSEVKEINEALKSASKRGTGHVGYPEYTAVVGDFVIVVEDKAAMDRQIRLTDSGILDMDVKAVADYAVNGAYFYAKHIARHTHANPESPHSSSSSNSSKLSHTTLPGRNALAMSSSVEAALCLE